MDQREVSEIGYTSAVTGREMRGFGSHGMLPSPSNSLRQRNQGLRKFLILIFFNCGKIYIT